LYLSYPEIPTKIQTRRTVIKRIFVFLPKKKVKP